MRDSARLVIAGRCMLRLLSLRADDGGFGGRDGMGQEGAAICGLGPAESWALPVDEPNGNNRARGFCRWDCLDLEARLEDSRMSMSLEPVNT